MYAWVMSEGANWRPNKKLVWTAAVVVGLAIMAIALAPAFLLKAYCSATEIDGYPTAYHVTEQSKRPEGDATNPPEPPFTVFSLGKTAFGLLAAIERTQTTDYAAPEPHTFWRRFFCGVNGADYLLALFTALLFFSTGLLWWVTERTLQHARADSKRQSEETREQIKLARQQFVATHRPRIAIRNITILSLVPDEPPNIGVTIVNVGSSTATISTIFANIGIRAWSGVRWDVPVQMRSVEGTPRELLSGEAMQFWTNGLATPTVLNAGHVNAINGLSSKLFVAGEIHYCDDNGSMRSTGFIRWYDSQFNRFSEVPSEWISSELEYED